MTTSVSSEDSDLAVILGETSGSAPAPGYVLQDEG
jgi:hypothetical protein